MHITKLKCKTVLPSVVGSYIFEESVDVIEEMDFDTAGLKRFLHDWFEASDQLLGCNHTYVISAQKTAPCKSAYVAIKVSLLLLTHTRPQKRVAVVVRFAVLRNMEVMFLGSQLELKGGFKIPEAAHHDKGHPNEHY